MKLACRACRQSIESDRGCAICLPIKKHLVATDELREDSPVLSEVGSETVLALREMLRTARKLLQEGNTKQRLQAANDVIKVSNSLAKVLEAARKLQNDGISAVENMSFLERMELFVGWYAQLPPPYRAKVREGQERWEESARRPALPEATTPGSEDSAP